MSHESLFEYVHTFENKQGMIKEYGVRANACMYVEVEANQQILMSNQQRVNRKERKRKIGLCD